MQELKENHLITDLDKEIQDVAIALWLPKGDPSGIRDKMFS